MDSGEEGMKQNSLVWLAVSCEINRLCDACASAGLSHGEGSAKCIHLSDGSGSKLVGKMLIAKHDTRFARYLMNHRWGDGRRVTWRHGGAFLIIAKPRNVDCVSFDAR